MIMDMWQGNPSYLRDARMEGDTNENIPKMAVNGT